VRLGINAGFGDPIQHELALLKTLGFGFVRQDLFAKGDAGPVEALAAEFANQQVVPLFLLAGGHIQRSDGSERIEPHELAARGRRVVDAANACGLTSYVVEVGNEPDIAHEGYALHPEDFAEAVRQSHEGLRGAGFDGLVITGGIANLDERGRNYLRRMLAAGTIPADVVVGFHRYPPTAKGHDAAHGFGSREEEWRALKQVTTDRRLACTEFGYHTAPDSVLGVFRHSRTDQEVANDVLFDIHFFEQHGVEFAAVFQLNDGPDPAFFEHHFGIRRVDGTLKPVAAAIQQAFGHA
jgi:hypothetical protein